MYNMCIELEDDIFNMIELFARDKTLNAYLYQIGIVEVLYTPLFSRTVIFAVLARCGNSRVVNFAILLMLSLL